MTEIEQSLQEQEQMRLVETEIIKQIAMNYISLENSIAKQLKMAAQKSHVTSGTFREDIWKSLFEQIIPRKFSIEQSVFIMDSEGHVSKEVDLVIFDEGYTPYIFRYGRIKYIPIEAVAVVVQCKSTNISGKNVTVLNKWSESITRLKTSLQSIARMYSNMAIGEFAYAKNDSGMFELPLNEKGQPDARSKLMQTSTRPIQILCHTSKSKSFIEPFDIIIHPVGDRLHVATSPNFPNLSTWYESLNHKEDQRYTNLKGTFNSENKSEDFPGSLDRFKVKEAEGKEIALLSLTFQLNQLLMLINNPILFPHAAYVNMFNDILNSKTGK